MNLQAEINYAKRINWAREICRIADKICMDRINDPSVMIDLLNGEIFAQAQDQFAKDKKMGKYDAMNISKEAQNDWNWEKV